MGRRAIAAVAAVAWLVGGSPAGAGERHSGTVAAIDSAARTVTIQELVEEGKPRTLQVHVMDGARISMSERTLDQLSAGRIGPFVDRTIQLSDVRPGDFVVIEATPRGRTHHADAITVTLRQ
jgi:hypothetical protein